MSKLIKNIYLDSYDFQKRRKFSVEYSWKAALRVVPASKSYPNLYFIVVSDNYIAPDGLQIGATQEVLDLLETCRIIEAKFEEIYNQGGSLELLNSAFVVEDLA